MGAKKGGGHAAVAGPTSVSSERFWGKDRGEWLVDGVRLLVVDDPERS